jgi:hypothetical protein
LNVDVACLFALVRELRPAAADLFVYNPQRAAWSVISSAGGPDTPQARAELGLAPTEDGGVFVFGGGNGPAGTKWLLNFVLSSLPIKKTFSSSPLNPPCSAMYCSNLSLSFYL